MELKTEAKAIQAFAEPKSAKEIETTFFFNKNQKVSKGRKYYKAVEAF